VNHSSSEKFLKIGKKRWNDPMNGGGLYVRGGGRCFYKTEELWGRRGRREAKSQILLR